MVTFGAWPNDPVAVTDVLEEEGEEEEAELGFDEPQPATATQARRGMAPSASKRRMETSRVVGVSPASLLC
jgi:hypothetical protein